MREVLFIGPGMQGKLGSVSDTCPVLSCFGLFHHISAYSLSRNTIESGSTMPLQNPLRLLRPSFSNFLFLSLTTVKTSQRTAVLSAISTGHARLLPPSLSRPRRPATSSPVPVPVPSPAPHLLPTRFLPLSGEHRVPRGGHGRSGGGSTLGRPPPPTPSSRFETWLDYS